MNKHQDQRENKPPQSDELFQELYDELKGIARVHMSRERSNHTLQPTALVNEAYLKLSQRNTGKKWNDREHFLRSSATAMRMILVDSARARQAKKRGGDVIKVELKGNEADDSAAPQATLDLHEALIKLEKSNPKIAELITLRYFGGLTHMEAANALKISSSSASNYWFFGKAWLLRELGQ